MVNVVTAHHRIAASHVTTCAIDSARHVNCWGYGRHGNLGNGRRGHSAQPVLARGVDAAVDLCMGNEHACALREDGTVSCWGNNPTGAIGNGKEGPKEETLRPTQVGGLGKTKAVRCGDYHTCALLEGGSVDCWGFNGHGQLGDGTRKNRSVPAAVKELTGIAELAAGWAHTCAVTHHGDVLCWGTNGSGQVAAGIHEQTTAYPQKAVANVLQIALGNQHSCAVRLGGSVHCWGIDSAHFQSGRAHAMTNVEVKQVGLDNGKSYAILASEEVISFHGDTVVAVPNLRQVVDLALGMVHACAITRGGDVACWGSNYHGALGNSPAADSPTPINVAGLKVAPTAN